MSNKFFWAFYTEGGSLMLRKFDTREELETWVGCFTLAHLTNPVDNCIEFTFYGELTDVGAGVNLV